MRTVDHDLKMFFEELNRLSKEGLAPLETAVFDMTRGKDRVHVNIKFRAKDAGK